MYQSRLVNYFLQYLQRLLFQQEGLLFPSCKHSLRFQCGYSKLLRKFFLFRLPQLFYLCGLSTADLNLPCHKLVVCFLLTDTQQYFYPKYRNQHSKCLLHRLMLQLIFQIHHWYRSGAHCVLPIHHLYSCMLAQNWFMFIWMKNTFVIKLKPESQCFCPGNYR